MGFSDYRQPIEKDLSVASPEVGCVHVCSPYTHLRAAESSPSSNAFCVTAEKIKVPRPRRCLPADLPCSSGAAVLRRAPLIKAPLMFT